MIESLFFSLLLSTAPATINSTYQQIWSVEQSEQLVAKAKKKKKRKKKKRRAKKRRSRRHAKKKAAKKKAATASVEQAPLVAPELTEPQPEAKTAAATTKSTTPEIAPLVAPEADTPQPSPASVEHLSSATDSASAETAPQQVAEQSKKAPASDDDEPRDVELRLRKLADELADAAAKSGKDPRYLRYALLPFKATDQETQKKGLGLVVTDIVGTSLVRDHGFALVERSRLKAVLDEMALQQSGLTEDKNAVELGKIANADVLIVGQIALLGDQYQVNAKLLDTATANVLGVADCKLPNADLVALSSDAVVLRSKSDAAFRSAVLPGWGQHYNRQPTKGWIFTGLVGTLLAVGAGLEGSGLGTYMLYYLPYQPKADTGLTEDGLRPGTPEYSQALSDRKSAALTQMNIGHVLLGATALVWAYNIADAYLSGVEGSEMVGSAGD